MTTAGTPVILSVPLVPVTLKEPPTFSRSIPSSLLLVAERLSNCTASVPPLSASMPPPVPEMAISEAVSVPTVPPLSEMPTPAVLPMLKPRRRLFWPTSTPSPLAVVMIGRAPPVAGKALLKDGKVMPEMAAMEAVAPCPMRSWLLSSVMPLL